MQNVVGTDEMLIVTGAPAFSAAGLSGKPSRIEPRQVICEHIAHLRRPVTTCHFALAIHF
jgi:hypothetical protein